MVTDVRPSIPDRRRVRVPTILQIEATECGAASLAMILAHHGRWVPLEEMRVATGVSRDGAKAGNLSRAGRAFGLDPRGLRLELGNLDEITVPFIAHWSFSHFVVVEGWNRHGVWINDPASGPRQVTWDEFDRSFTGIALEFGVGEEFTRGGRRPSTISGLRSRASGNDALLLCVLAGILLILPGLLLPAITRLFVDQVLIAHDTGWAQTIVLGLLLTIAFQVGLVLIQQITLLRLSVKLAVAMSGRFMAHVLTLPLEYFNQRFAGLIASRVAINDQIAALLSSQLATTVLAMIVALAYAVVMLIYQWQLGLIAIAFTLVNVGALQAVSRRRRVANQKLIHDAGTLHATALIGLQNIETLKSTGEEGDFFERWSGTQSRVVNATQELGRPTVIVEAVPPLVAGLQIAAVLGVGALLVYDGSLTLGGLLAFQVLAAGIAVPVQQLVRLGQTIQEMQGNLENIDDTLHYPAAVELVPPPPGDDLPARLQGRIELRGVSFGYSRLDPPLIDDLDLVIEPGQRIALVGATGSGKSTVARIATGLLQQWSGEILIDGVPRERYARSVITANVAFVDQEIHLFAGTVRDNLTLWDTTIAESRYRAAARDAAILDDILDRPLGLDHPVLEDGRDWSGGQRQRLEIARALAGDPAILVMDEATSALDPVVELQIDRAIRARGCACLIVAHRLSTIRDCDEIIVLDHGKPVERGTHAELIALDGHYAQLVAE